MLELTDIIFLILVIAYLVLLAVLYFYHLKNNKQTEKMYQQIADMRRLIEVNQLGIEEIRSSSIGMGKAIGSLKNQINTEIEQLNDKQNELALQDPESKLYSRAAKMVAKGASLDEIMHECEIPLAEAQLVMSMRGR